jgi:hypothetical protein
MVAVKEFSWEEVSGPNFGNPAGQAWQQAVAQVEEQLRTKLHVEVLPERQRKALEFVRADAVTLHPTAAPASPAASKPTRLPRTARARTPSTAPSCASTPWPSSCTAVPWPCWRARRPPRPAAPPQRHPAPACLQRWRCCRWQRLARPARPCLTRGTCTRHPPARASSSASGTWNCSTRCAALTTPNCSAA